ncbi:MAG: M3 family oligoendopeptidase [Deltaproteobacteria bacterium]|nr:M3 family oligoendopeptidase [Deltaproteobacteria bacterium]
MYQLSGFIPADLQINSWDDLKPYFEKLLHQDIKSVEDLERLIVHYSEAISVYHEQNARSYINMTCHTNNEDYVKRHELFAVELGPKLETICNQIDKKITASDFFKNLPEERYACYKQSIARDLELFREKNVNVQAELSKMVSEFEQLAGKLMVEYDGEKLPIPMVSKKLLSSDRSEREKAWFAIQDTRYQSKDEHDQLFDQMIKKRHELATNAGYKNFRDYKHDALHRFDYTVKDVLQFQESIEELVVPLANKLLEKQKNKLGITDSFRPWDSSGKPKDEKPLEPFEKAEELLGKTKDIFAKLDPQFKDNLQKMDDAKLFDLESRANKAPGGYNYGLEITGMPFIFMNAAGTHRDVVTLMHEGGHAMHTFLTNNEPLINYRNTPSEMAETASMSMELLTAKHWGEFYNEEDFKRARQEHMEGVIDTFPWVATVDAFQHWVYTNPEHTVEDRDGEFEKLMQRFGGTCVDWSGLEKYRRNFWQKQLHIFSVPFYYIEYAIAQIGALQVYRNFKKDEKAGLEAYKRGLSLGSSKPLPQVWEAMGIKFDFSKNNLKALMDFVSEELASLGSL